MHAAGETKRNSIEIQTFGDKTSKFIAIFMCILTTAAAYRIYSVSQCAHSLFPSQDNYLFIPILIILLMVQTYRIHISHAQRRANTYTLYAILKKKSIFV